MKKILLVCSILIVYSMAAPTAEMMEEMNRIMGECSAETGVSKDVFTDLMTGNFDGVDHDVKCFIKCALEKKGIFTADGHLDTEFVAEKCQEMEPELIEKFQACYKEAEDPCETAFNLLKCKHEVGADA